MGLKARTRTVFHDALRMCGSAPGSEALQAEIKSMLGRIEEPLRVAVVGVMKAGKSTLMNALLKEPVLITGTVETTYTVSWFRYGKEPALTIVFRDGTEQKALFSDLELWTVRAKLRENPRMDDVKYIIIYYPNEVLKQMELIDTPGLLSSYGIDSENTLDFLGLKKDADEATRQEASNADAVVFAFTRGLQQSNAELLASFHGSATSSTPINAIGVFTQADILWDLKNDPLEIAAGVTRNIMAEPQVKKLLYTTLPVSAKLLECAGKLTEAHWETLAKLAELQPQVLLDILADKSTFTKFSAQDLAEGLELDESLCETLCSSAQRESVCALVGQYGIYVFCEALRKGLTRQDCISYATKKSGMEAVSDLILRHFGNRSLIIKLKYIFAHMKQTCKAIAKASMQANTQDICDFIYNEIDTMETTEQVFRELDVLQAYYNGLLKLSGEAELEEILQLTGEQGMGCEARLGIQEGASIRELEALSKQRAMQWNARANDFTASRGYCNAATIMARSCDLMHYHLQVLLGIDH